MGALEGVLRYLGHDYQTAYLMGATGHAFRLDLPSRQAGVSGGESPPADEQALIGPEGPISIDFQRAASMYARLGRSFTLLSASKADRDYEKACQEALKEMKRSIDRGVPAIAFDLNLPEFGVVKGYDDRQQAMLVDTVLTPQTGEVLPYDRWPSTQDVGLVFVFIPSRKASAPDLAMAEREALRFALAHAEGSEGGLPSAGAYHGFAAYDFWAKTLEGEAKVSGFGNAYTGQVLQAARRHAGQFLRELAAKYPGAAEQLSQAASAYERAALTLTRFTTLFPFPLGGEIDNPGARRPGAAYLRQALAEEGRAIEAIGAALSQF